MAQKPIPASGVRPNRDPRLPPSAGIYDTMLTNKHV